MEQEKNILNRNKIMREEILTIWDHPEDLWNKKGYFKSEQKLCVKKY